jgi:hypothetical protein
MSDDTAQEPEQPAQAPRSVSLTDEDRRFLAALLAELVGTTKDGRPTLQSHDTEETSRAGDAARTAMRVLTAAHPDFGSRTPD